MNEKSHEMIRNLEDLKLKISMREKEVAEKDRKRFL